MKNYELASKELYEFEEALKKAKDASMEVEWFSAFTDALYNQSIMSDFPEKNMHLIIDKANKKLGM